MLHSQFAITVYLYINVMFRNGEGSCFILRISDKTKARRYREEHLILNNRIPDALVNRLKENSKLKN